MRHSKCVKRPVRRRAATNTNGSAAFHVVSRNPANGCLVFFTYRTSDISRVESNLAEQIFSVVSCWSRKVLMALVGTLCFCTDCGDLLPRAAPDDKGIICDACGTTNAGTRLFDAPVIISYCELTSTRQMAAPNHQHFQARRIPLEAAAKAQRGRSRHLECRNQGRQSCRVSVREVWRAGIEICRASAEKCRRRHHAFVPLSEVRAPISTGELNGIPELRNGLRYLE